MTEPLFDLGGPAKPKKKRAPSSKPTWSKYRPAKPERCHHCVLRLHKSGGNAPRAAAARWRRRLGDDELLLCYVHASAQRVVDGLPALDPKG